MAVRKRVNLAAEPEPPQIAPAFLLIQRQFLSSVEGACSRVPACPLEAFACTVCQTRVSGTAGMRSMARSHRLTGEYAKAG